MALCRQTETVCILRMISKQNQASKMSILVSDISDCNVLLGGCLPHNKIMTNNPTAQTEM